MGYNTKSLAADAKIARVGSGAKAALSSTARRINNKGLESELGYSDGSIYRDSPYIDIHTPNGIIDMTNTSIPLYANGRYLPPNSGMHQFNTNTVREIPYQDGGEVMELTDEEIEYYRGLGYRIEEIE